MKDFPPGYPMNTEARQQTFENKLNFVNQFIPLLYTVVYILEW